MATVTIAFGSGQCQHVTFTLLRGSKTHVLTMTRNELIDALTDEDAIKTAFMAQLRAFVIEQRAAGKTWAQIKTLAESRTWVI